MKKRTLAALAAAGLLLCGCSGKNNNDNNTKNDIDNNVDNKEPLLLSLCQEKAWYQHEIIQIKGYAYSQWQDTAMQIMVPIN